VADDLAVTGARTSSIAAGGRELAVRVRPARDQPFPLFPSMGEYPVYDDIVYDGFDQPDARVRAYREAIEDAAGGKIVLDIGTGRDALWAIHAARAGARHVFAVEQHPHVAGRARQAIAAAGLAARITVIEGLSTEVVLTEPAQVCISEIVGNIASAEGAIAALGDARQRLCTPGCVWIPFRIQTWAAAVDLSGHHPALATESVPYLKQVFDAVGHPFDLRLCLGGPAGSLPISGGAAVESIVFDRRRDPPASDATSIVELTIDVPAARMTGLMLWTRVAVTSHTAEIDTLTSDTLSWAPIYAPLSPGGVPVRHGDAPVITFERATSDDGRHPDYRLSATRPRTGGEAATWTSRHHGSDFRVTPLHRHLFPAP
jgi:protein arginine N-methyltransferase 1